MSIFKEKDDYIKKAFEDIFCRDSDSDDEEFQDNSIAKKFKLEREGEKEDPGINDYCSSGTIATQDDEVDDDANIGNEIEKEERKEASYIDSDCKGSKPVECIEVSDSENESQANPTLAPVKRSRYSTRKKNLVKQSTIPEIIHLSSDEEQTQPVAVRLDQVSKSSCDRQSIKEQQNQVPNASPDHFFNLKVQVSGSIKTFRTTNNQKLSKILEEFLLQVKVRGHTLVVTLDDKPISLEETPNSLNLSYTDKLHAIEVSPLEESGDSAPKLPARAATPPKAPNEIKVKLQDGNMRHTKEFRIFKDQTVDQLKNLYAKEFNITNLDSIKLWFDGDPIDDGLTPEELDIEDDCVLDVMIHN